MTTSQEPKPSIFQLWLKSDGDAGRYRELMHEYGYLLYPGDPGYEEASVNLPCGWPHRKERN